MKKNIYAIIVVICFFFCSCKKDKLPNQIGTWRGHHVVERYQAGGNVNTYTSDFELELRADEKALFHYDNNVMREQDWDLLGGGKQIMIINQDITFQNDTLISFRHYNIVVDQKDYQEWHYYYETFFMPNSPPTWWREDTFTLHRK